MKTVSRILLVALMLAATSPVFAQFKTGKELVKYWQAFQRATKSPSSDQDCADRATFMGYVAAANDALLLVDADYALAVSQFNNLKVRQVCVMVGQYLDKHPEEWHLPGVVIAQKALRRAFLKDAIDYK